MKKLLCILLAVMTLAVPALAEDANPFAPYVLTAPDGAALEDGEGSLVFVAENARVVAQVIDRVPDEDPAEAILRMMTQFEPFAIVGGEIETAEGFVALSAMNEDKFGEGIDLITVMVLSAEGDLLILSAYEMGGDEELAQTLLDELLASLTVNGMFVFPMDK